jgi:glycerol-3-phosphate dehydrogenase
MNRLFDVLIIGGGAVGSAVARELSAYKLKTGVLEKNLDVCNETSGRNSGVVHGGFAYDTGTLKAVLCVQGNRMMDQLAGELGFTFRRCGKVLVGTTEEERKSLERTIEQGHRNGVTGLALIGEAELHHLVPKAVGRFAMFSKNSGIVDPFNYTIALAENAALNGVQYFFNTEVTSINHVENCIWQLHTSKGIYSTRWVINAAGLGCGKVSDMLGITGYKIIGSKGDYIILDKRTGVLLPMPVYPVPSNTYMGIHVTNTTDGNVIVGPNADMVTNFDWYGVRQKNLDYLTESASRIWPCIRKEDCIRNYSGILPKLVDDNGEIQDFRIEIRQDIAPCAVNLVGIESPGLTAAVPIAERVIEMMKDYEKLERNPSYNPRRNVVPRFSSLGNEDRASLVKENPDYGEVVCRCEKVTKAEILNAIHNPLGVHTVTGIKYRTRAMMGRCQGGYCQMRITNFIEQELGIKPEDILYERKGSYIFTGSMR